MQRVGGVRPWVVALTRIVVGFLFACHGLKTVFGLLGAHAAAPVGAWPGWWAGLIQVVCGALLVVGLGTRAAALLGSGAMAFAYFTTHAPHGFFPINNGGEAAALFSWMLLLLAATGPGTLALDGLLGRRHSDASPTTASDPQPIAG